jgi:uncharacterized protein (UPF0333 family)
MFALIKNKIKTRKAQLSIEFILYILIIITILFFYINIEVNLQGKYNSKDSETKYIIKLNYLKEKYFIKNSIYEYKKTIPKK